MRILNHKYSLSNPVPVISDLLPPALMEASTSFHFSAVILLFLLTFPNSSALTVSPYLKLPLVHKTPLTPSQALAADNRRLSELHKHPRLPVTSAASSGSGQYLVSIHLGTPPQRLLLVADTGSDLTWTACSACRRHCSKRASYFFPRHSTTFSPYHCFDSSCRLVPPPKKPVHCNRTRLHSACRYEYSYADGSVTSGFFSHETTAFNTTVGQLQTLNRLSFGCGFWNSGTSYNGVLGLGRGPISFPSQLGRKFGHRFSYCLMDYTLSPPPTSYLLIGAASGKAKLSYTPLLINPLSPTFYYIAIQNVLIDDVKLRISPSVWTIDDSGNGGTVIDSGSTLSFFPKSAYEVILAALDRLVKLPRITDPSISFDLCVNVSSSSAISFPQMSFKFSGGALFSPPPSNYFIEAAEGVKCLAVQPVASESGFSVLGNLMQQGYALEFDRDRSRLGFTRQGCGEP